MDSPILPVDIAFYQGFWALEPVCKKYLPTIFTGASCKFFAGLLPEKAKAQPCSRLRFLTIFLLWRIGDSNP